MTLILIVGLARTLTPTYEGTSGRYLAAEIWSIFIFIDLS